MKSKLKLAILILLVCGLSLILFLYTNNTTKEPVLEIFTFKTIVQNNNSLDVVKVNKANVGEINFYFQDNKNERFINIKNLKDKLKKEGKNLIFATNGGIFNTDFYPAGLYIENGKDVRGINLNKGDGNFYLQPNGVFFIKDNIPQIVSSSGFISDKFINFAIQSGPMLLSDNIINPAFNLESQNKYIRNGVGVNSDNDVFFVISNEPVTFFEFADLFKETLKCKDALYLDGSISKMYVEGHRDEAEEGNFSVIIGVVEG